MHKPIDIYAIFHLNLAFSSIEEQCHAEVIQNCYWPLLNVIEKFRIPLGIELTAYTLEKILLHSPAWVDRFKQLLAEEKCELIASGDSQIIGPLVPAKVNEKNLALGQNHYLKHLNVQPQIAYVNEQAVSSGLLDIYLDAGFNKVVIEWDNPFSHNDNWKAEYLYQSQQLYTANGRRIGVIWNNAIAFQKLQRFAHGEMTVNDYLTYLKHSATQPKTSFAIYGSDAEIFDYRPGRYQTEQKKHEQEWHRLTEIFVKIKGDSAYRWCTPSETFKSDNTVEALSITNAAYPVCVKKQAKYNVTRWALSGRDDVYLNTQCYSQYQFLVKTQNESDEDWGALCRLWASDLRTHLTENRFSALQEARINLQATHFNADETQSFGKHGSNRGGPVPQGYEVHHDKLKHRFYIKSESTFLVLNTLRGLSIDSLAFKAHQFKPICGTLHHGYFDHISFAADFYSNHLVMERFRQRDRVTDLSKAEPELGDENGILYLATQVPSPIGPIGKWYRIDSNRLQCGFEFPHNQRPEASLRLGFITLLDCDARSWYRCQNGGYELERFESVIDYDHGSPVSSIVSATCATGATNGEIHFGSRSAGIRLSWQPHECAAIPMLSSKQVNQKYLNRLWFSLVESDETLKPGGILPNFSFTISPIAKD